jgi:hypothetical protein
MSEANYLYMWSLSTEVTSTRDSIADYEPFHTHFRVRVFVMLIMENPALTKI